MRQNVATNDEFITQELNEQTSVNKIDISVISIASKFGPTFETSDMYQAHPFAEIFPITSIGWRLMLDIEKARTLNDKLAVITQEKELKVTTISKWDLNNPYTILHLYGAFICVADDYDTVKKHANLSLILKMLEIGARASWFHDQGESCIF